jgi:two-component system response regulator MprA
VLDTGTVQATRVLVVEDDARLRASLARGLRGHDLDVITVGDGASALAQASQQGQRLDVIVLDIGLPDSDGRDVCQALRAGGVTAPVLFLTARGQVGDLLSGFAAGGDDYLAKPFHFAELVARVVALARRNEASSAGVAQDDAPHLDPRTHSIVAGDQRTSLTPTEYRILATLLGAGERVVRRRELVASAWPAGAIVHDNTLDQYVARIRRKLGGLEKGPALVTVHGIGYRIS